MPSPGPWMTTYEVDQKHGVRLSQANLDPCARFFIRSKLLSGPGFPRVWFREDVEFHCPTMKQEQFEEGMRSKIFAGYDIARKERASFWMRIRMRDAL